jgi:hypothetical protein
VSRQRVANSLLIRAKSSQTDPKFDPILSIHRGFSDKNHNKSFVLDVALMKFLLTVATQGRYYRCTRQHIRCERNKFKTKRAETFMNFRLLNDLALADFAKNLRAQLEGDKLKSIDTNVRADLALSIGTIPDLLGTQTASVAAAEAARKEAVSNRNATRQVLISLVSQIRNALRAGLASKEQYDLCAFDYPAMPSPYDPKDPSDLSATGTSNGVNTVRFTGNNKAGRVVFEVWRRQGDEGLWMLHATTKRQRYTDNGVTPGQYYEYKVRAVAARATSNFSNSGVVYGVL